MLKQKVFKIVYYSNDTQTKRLSIILIYNQKVFVGFVDLLDTWNPIFITNKNVDNGKSQDGSKKTLERKRI